MNKTLGFCGFNLNCESLTANIFDKALLQKFCPLKLTPTYAVTSS